MNWVRFPKLRRRWRDEFLKINTSLRITFPRKPSTISSVCRDLLVGVHPNSKPNDDASGKGLVVQATMSFPWNLKFRESFFFPLRCSSQFVERRPCYLWNPLKRGQITFRWRLAYLGQKFKLNRLRNGAARDGRNSGWAFQNAEKKQKKEAEKKSERNFNPKFKFHNSHQRYSAATANDDGLVVCTTYHPLL